MALVEGVFASLLANLLTNLLPHGVVRLLVHVKRTRHFLRFWGAMLRPSLLLVVSSPADVREDRPLLGNDSRAVTDLILEFGRINLDVSLISGLEWSDKVAGELLTNNLLIIGGPVTNSTAGFHLALPEIPYKFCAHYIVRTGDPTFKMGVPTRDEVVGSKDYAIITRMQNRYADNHDAIIVSGCHGWGTRAAAQALTDNRVIKYLNKNATRHFQVIVEVPVDESGRPANPNPLWHTLKPLPIVSRGR